MCLLCATNLIDRVLNRLNLSGPGRNRKKIGRARPAPRFRILFRARVEIVTFHSGRSKIFIFSLGRA